MENYPSRQRQWPHGYKWRIPNRVIQIRNYLMRPYTGIHLYHDHTIPEILDLAEIIKASKRDRSWRIHYTNLEAMHYHMLHDKWQDDPWAVPKYMINGEIFYGDYRKGKPK